MVITTGWEVTLASLFWQTLQTWRQAWWSWVAILALLSLAVEALYPGLGDDLFATSGLVTGLLRFLHLMSGRPLVSGPVADWIQTAGFEVFFALGVAIFAIWMGSRLLAGEREKKTLALLLAYPRARQWFLLEIIAALFVAVLALAVALWALLAVGAGFFHLTLSPGRLAAAAGQLFFFALAFGSLAMALSLWSGSARVGCLGALAALLLAYLAYAAPSFSDGLAWLRQFSPLSFAFGNQPLVNGFALGGSLALLAMSVACFGLSGVGFERLDLA